MILINSILDKFKSSEKVKIRSSDKLKEYIDFCIDNNDCNNKLTAHHHILPKSIFKYKNLNNYKWNGTYLSYYNHYYAHWLLIEAIDNYEMSIAFFAMHNQGYKSGRILKHELISPNVYNNQMYQRNKAHKEYMNELVDVDGVTMTRYKENGLKTSNTVTKIINIDGKPTTIAKERSKKTTKARVKSIVKDGKITSIAKLGGLKMSNNMKQEFIRDGKVTNKYKENAKKHSISLNREFIIDGKVTTIAKENSRKRDIVMKDKFIKDGKVTNKYKEANKKAIKTRLDNGVNSIIGIKTSKSLKKEFIKDGKVTNKYIENGIKSSKTRSIEFIKNGKVTTINKQIKEKAVETIRAKGKWFNIYKDNEIISKIYNTDLYKISSVFHKATKSRPLGSHKSTLNKLKEQGLEEYIGCYVKLITDIRNYNE